MDYDPPASLPASWLMLSLHLLPRFYGIPHLPALYAIIHKREERSPSSVGQ
ncbi:hypothetical protein LY78DRAFT_350134 [Colletotrichum sublineola]|nr:hypothetical protein LY78DRAFT_350134 [Colletotrichum sublineola]